MDSGEPGCGRTTRIRDVVGSEGSRSNHGHGTDQRKTEMTESKLDDSASVRDGVLSVLRRMRTNPACRRQLLPDFSIALNAVGEPFVYLLLQRERKGAWWLTDDGEWHECSLKSLGRRVPRNFLPGSSPEWGWFPATSKVRHIADRMTGPDHVVTVKVKSLKLSMNVVLEQKLRFGTNQDAVATASTYVYHLRKGLKGEGDVGFLMPEAPAGVDHEFVDRFLAATKKVLLKTKRDVLLHCGSVPQVCFVSVQTPPHKVFVCNKDYRDTVDCNAVGFLAPAINHAAFSCDSVARRIVQQAKVRLWLGLDSLLDQCGTEEVEEAWGSAIEQLNASVRNPGWDTRVSRPTV